MVPRRRTSRCCEAGCAEASGAGWLLGALCDHRPGVLVVRVLVAVLVGEEVPDPDHLDGAVRLLDELLHLRPAQPVPVVVAQWAYLVLGLVDHAEERDDQALARKPGRLA